MLSHRNDSDCACAAGRGHIGWRAEKARCGHITPSAGRQTAEGRAELKGCPPRSANAPLRCRLSVSTARQMFPWAPEERPSTEPSTARQRHDCQSSLEGSETPELKRSTNPQMQSNFTQPWMKKTEFSSAAVVSTNCGAFSLDKLRLKHGIASPTKHRRQLQMSSKCHTKDCTNAPALGFIILGNCKG